MKYFISATDNDLEMVIADCKDYAQSCENDVEREEYLNELETHQDWSIANTGVFHDAIGKVVKVFGNGLYYEDEY